MAVDDPPAGSGGRGSASGGGADSAGGGGAWDFGGGGRLGGAELRAHYARLMMQPEWMTDVPPDLAENW